MNLNRDEHEDKDASSERWLVSYADFITLMFAFFAVLYATSEKNFEKANEFQESVKKYLIKAGAFGESGQQIHQGDKHNQIIEPPIQTFRPDASQPSDVLDKTEQFIESQLKPEERKKYILDIHDDPEWGIRVVISAASIYSPKSEKFKEEAMGFINKIGKLVVMSRRKVLIEGHVAKDEKGDHRSTWDFASARAVNLLRFIQQKQRVPPANLTAASFADSRPIFQNNRASDNSRIEVVLLRTDLNL